MARGRGRAATRAASTSTATVTRTSTRSSRRSTMTTTTPTRSRGRGRGSRKYIVDYGETSPEVLPPAVPAVNPPPPAATRQPTTERSSPDFTMLDSSSLDFEDSLDGPPLFKKNSRDNAPTKESTTIAGASKKPATESAFGQPPAKRLASPNTSSPPHFKTPSTSRGRGVRVQTVQSNVPQPTTTPTNAGIPLQRTISQPVARNLFQFLDDDDDKCSPIRNLRYNYLKKNGDDDEEDSQALMESPVAAAVIGRQQPPTLAESESEAAEANNSDISKFRAMLQEMNLCNSQESPKNSQSASARSEATTPLRSAAASQATLQLALDWDDDDLLDDLDLTDLVPRPVPMPVPPPSTTPTVAPVVPNTSRLSLSPPHNRPAQHSTPLPSRNRPTAIPLPLPLSTIVDDPAELLLDDDDFDDFDFIDVVAKDPVPPKMPTTATVTAPPPGSTSPNDLLNDDLTDDDFDNIDISAITTVGGAGAKENPHPPQPAHQVTMKLRRRKASPSTPNSCLTSLSDVIDLLRRNGYD